MRRKRKAELEKELRSKGVFNRPAYPYRLRECDKYGCGHFGAPRGRKNHRKSHQGLDISMAKGQKVFSPIDGKVVRKAHPYADDLSWSGILIKGTGRFSGVSVKVFYMEPTIAIGETVSKGDTIGKAQDIGGRYPGITPHIHLELRLAGLVVDPKPYFS